MNLTALQKWSRKSTALKQLIAIFGSQVDEGRALRWLGAFACGDFSGLPPVITLPGECMPGLWGGYSREKNRIYISGDCPPEYVDKVLIEEIGHFLDRELCVNETPGEEGARFAALVLGLRPTAGELQNWETDEGWSWIFDGSKTVLVEGAKKSKSKSNSKGGGAKNRKNSSFKSRFSSSASAPAPSQPSPASPAPNNVPPPQATVPPISNWVDKETIQSFAGQTLYGNAGNDTFVVTDKNVYIIDTMGGVNSIKTSVDGLDLSDFPVSHLEFTAVGSVGARGNNLANSLIGNAGDNTFDGGTGSDTIEGRGGNDFLDGEGGSDFVSGGDGNDTIAGDETDASLDGGDDADWLKVGANFNDASDAQISGIENVEVAANGLTIYLGDQTEGFAVRGFADGATTFVGGSGADTFTGGSGADSIDGGIGADSISAGSGEDTISGAQDDALLGGGDGADWLKVGANFNDASDAQISGIENVEVSSSGLTLNLGDQLEGLKIFGFEEGITNIIAGAGADSIIAGSGADTISAGAGNDTIVGAQNDALLDGGDGADWLQVKANFNDASDAQILGIENVEVAANGLTMNLGDQAEGFAVRGFADGATTFVGGSGADTFFGGSGGDLIDGADGVDSILAGAGNDSILGAQNDVMLDGGTGADWLKVGANFDDSGDAQIANIENVEVTAGGLTVNLGGQTEGFAVSGFADGATTFFGGSGADTFTGGSGADSVAGGSGADSILASVGSDTIVGAENDSLLDGGSGTDWLKIGANFDDSGDAQIANIENVEVTSNGLTINLGDQTEGVNISGFTGGGTNITAGAGRDSIVGGSGADNMSAGEGDDTIVGAVNDALLDGGSGTDWLKIGANFNDSGDAQIANIENVEVTSNWLTINLGDQTEGFTISGFSSGSTNITAGAGADSIIGGTGADAISAGAGNDTIVAAQDDALLDGGEDIDWLKIGANFNDSGDAQITHIENIEVLATGLTINLGDQGEGIWVKGFSAGATTFIGGSGQDTFTGGIGAESIDGGAGVDTMIGGQGNDTYFVDSTGDVVTESDASTITGGVDWAIVSASSYSLSANIENLTYVGSVDATFAGNGGNNRINASLAGNNNLSGGAGNDTLVVDANRVGTVDGGADNDTLLFISNAGMTIGDSGFGGFANIESYDFSGVLGNVDITIGSTAQGLGIATLSGGTGNSTLTADTTFGSNPANSISAVYFTGGSGSDSLSGNSGNDTLLGGIGNDTIPGGSGNDSLDGGFGNDSMVGGLGNDTCIVDSSSDTVVELAAQGTDVVISSIHYTLGNNVESLILAGSATLNGTGNSLNNSLYGNSGANSLSGESGDDFLDGKEGIDTLIGGSGNDTYVIDVSARDLIVEDATISGGSADEIQVNGTFSIADPANLAIGTPPPGEFSGIEILRYTGNGNVSLTGNKLANTIIANDGADSLTGGLGADSLIGGSGNDTYIYEGSDTLVEVAGGGVDEVRSSEDINLTTISEVENIVLTGSGGIAAIGNSSNNSIVGNESGNVLRGADGNDTVLGNGGDDLLDGGAGADSLIGGLGNDTYILDESLTDQIIENVGEGTDEIQAPASVDLTLLLGIENVVLLGSGSFSVLGNTSGNRIQGNAGNNSLDGGGGVDTLIGGSGDDTYFVDVAGDVVQEQIGSGNDLVIFTGGSFVLPNFVENLKVNGGQGSSGTGNLDPNLITGNLSNNSLFGGGGGADTLVGDEGDDYLDGGFDNQISQNRDSMVGGKGDDTYVIDGGGTFGDQIVEQSGEGTDTIQIRLTTLSYVRANATSGTVFGVNLGGVVFELPDLAATPPNLGGGAQIQLYFNKLVLGDLYFNPSNSVPDAITPLLGFNADRNYFYVLPVNFENLDIFNQNITINRLISGAGQFQPNFVYGNATGNYIKTLDEVAIIGGFNNHIDGQGGADTMAGGLGNDTYVVDDAGDLVLELSSQGTDWIFASASCTLQGNVENLRQMEVTETIVGGQPDTLAVADFNFHGTGNAIDNLIEGNSGNNSLSGLDGADTITGGAGNDTIVGGDGNDSLVGGEGIDSMVGGAGDDIYSVENEADVIVDSSGFDIVFSSQSYVLSTDLEVLVLQGGNNIAGWGNANDNSLLGNAGNNILIAYGGNDTLDGGGGSDTLSGGAGNDYYVFRSGFEILSENFDQGTDTVFSLENYTLAVNFENLILGGLATAGQGNSVANSLTANATQGSNLQGLEGNDSIVGGGGDDNLFGGADNDSIIGGGGNDDLDGGAGADTMSGGSGNDVYIVDNTSDIVFESPGSGTDLIQSSVNITLSNNVENLLLTGGGNLNGRGNEISNNLTGNSGDNFLWGQGGRDNLLGLAGADTLDGGNLEDSLVGGAGNDSLHGGTDTLLGGNDILNGTDSTARGANEVDTLTGGGGGDLFVLGDGTNAYYNTSANDVDYAYITDFSLSAGDQLQLRNLTTGATHVNRINGYLIGDQIYGAFGSANCYLYRDNDNNGTVGAGDNLIAAIVATGGSGTGGALQIADLNTIGIFV